MNKTIVILDIDYQLPRVRRDQMGALGGLLMVCPDKYTGLTPKQLNKIDKFASPGGEDVR